MNKLRTLGDQITVWFALRLWVAAKFMEWVCRLLSKDGVDPEVLAALNKVADAMAKDPRVRIMDLEVKIHELERRR